MPSSAMAARLALNQEMGVRVFPWQRRSDAKFEAFFGTRNGGEPPGNRTSDDVVLGSYVVVVLNGQHASPPRWRYGFDSHRPHEALPMRSRGLLRPVSERSWVRVPPSPKGGVAQLVERLGNRLVSYSCGAGFSGVLLHTPVAK